MDWNNLIGERGRALFKPGTYTDNDGKSREKTDVSYFIDYNPKYFEDEETFDSIPDDDDLPFD